MSSGEYRRSRTVLISYFWKFCNNLGLNLGMKLKNFGFWLNFSIKHQKAQVNRNNTRQTSHAHRSELRLIGTMFSLSYNFYYMISIRCTIPTHSTYLLWRDYALWQLHLFQVSNVCLEMRAFFLQHETLKTLPRVPCKCDENTRRTK